VPPKREKNRRIFREKPEELCKEYTKTLQLHIKTNPTNFGH
jgi:hypothetical protein